MNNKWLTVIFLLVFVFSCGAPGTKQEAESIDEKEIVIDVQGHRGARGIRPENTLEAFDYALKAGVTTLELDLAVTKDRKIVVSHEPYISSQICVNPDGTEIDEDSAQLLNIYEMTYDQVRQYDCGSKGNSNFPEQEKMKAFKPLLTEVFELSENYQKVHEADPVNYNIELKSVEELDDLYHPAPSVFSDLVYNLIDSVGVSWDRITIQSFDFRVLQYFEETYPDVRLAVLIENERPWDENIDALGFTPAIYSAYHIHHTKDNIAEIQKGGMMVIPWTVNEKARMKELVSWGVDGIITDYPQKAIELLDINK